MRISVEETAKDMGIPKEAVRILAQHGKLPFMTAVKTSSVYRYYGSRERYELWKQGKLGGEQ